ncbi:hypothetical protein COY26_02235 [Candidatus Woesearchaeota archaeon CG_4_10_14_0_2_um_filter_33_10]|nr:MAG: hypothetical protein COV14_01375 [Candidatus Woesearchaeota archaeon CG10_big_fil_rev_8_21_14_0_10_33_12]PIU72516.1 MAG: hypothetical protein COS79_02555 [Candidatus Woesearchaeota archaeon CG06_land_8_20_14_3_00_33_13]PIZ53355.1 MAG: hypothetical protein COY26_02235 [Candidatus Woesearchaeota archaeon CG_4_10_14_0_2_um_filter_33_10]
MYKSTKKGGKNKTNKIKYNFKKPNSKIIIFYVILIFLIILLSFFYFNAIKRMPSNFTGIHYYEYYTSSVILTEKIRNLEFKDFYQLFLLTYADKLIILGRIPFFLLFTSTTLTFNFSNYFINMFLLIILFRTLLKIEKPFKAFTLILLVLGSKFFLETLLSFYIDLTYMLVFSIFLIYLYEFDKNHKKNNISLTLLVSLLFFTKNISYLIIPILLIFLTFYYYFYKKEKWSYLKKIWIIFLIGFLIYFTISTGLRGNRLMSDIDQGAGGNFEVRDFGFTMKSISNYFLKNIREGTFKNYLFLHKFNSIWISLALYLILIYNIISKKNKFWVLMFIFSDIFFFFFYNIKGHHFEFRYVTMFYLIYFYLFYDFIYVICKRLFRKYGNHILLFIISLLFLFNFLQIAKNMQNPNDYTPTYFSFTSELIINVEQGSKVYIDTEHLDDPLHYNYRCDALIRYNDLNLTRLTNINPRFAYTITDDIKTADYILTSRIQNFNMSHYTIIDHLPPPKYDPRDLYLIKEKEKS